jgi:hypothetical protein
VSHERVTAAATNAAFLPKCAKAARAPKRFGEDDGGIARGLRGAEKRTSMSEKEPRFLGTDGRVTGVRPAENRTEPTGRASCPTGSVRGIPYPAFPP